MNAIGASAGVVGPRWSRTNCSLCSPYLWSRAIVSAMAVLDRVLPGTLDTDPAMRLAQPVQLALAFLLAAGSAFRPSEPGVARGREPTGPHIVFSGVRHRQQVILGETFPFAIEVVGFRLPDGKQA